VAVISSISAAVAPRAARAAATFERAARFQDEQRLVQRKGAHARAPIGFHLDQPFLGQAYEHRAQRGPTDAEPFGDVDLHQSLTRRVHALFDLRAQPRMSGLKA
jgi:hypothetical protein